jgi:ParB/RepB/Spo0J family partition protein
VERTGSPRSGGEAREPDTIRDLPLREIDDSDDTYRFQRTEAGSSLAQSLARDGQLTPILVIAGRIGFRIIDGFRRTAAARELGWTTIRARVHPPMLSDEAKKIAFVSNVVRRDLTVREKVHAIQMARRVGFSKRDVAEMFGISQRQIERYASLPDDVLELIDGKRITMAHARVLARQRPVMTIPQLEALVARIRGDRMSAPELAKWLTANGPSRSPAGAGSTLGTITRDRVRLNSLELTRRASPESLAATAAFLRRALCQIEAFAASEGASERESDEDVAAESEA